MVKKQVAVSSAAEMMAAPISKLHFFPQNPRREPNEDQDAIRKELCEEEGVINLARHLSRHGINPLDLPALIAHPKLPKHFVVVEGNRRLCALQLLRDPERAPTTASRKVFEKLKAEGVALPTTISAVLFGDADAARVWMSVKHEGAQGGIGTVEWDASQKTRFNQQGERSQTRPKNPNVQALALLDYAQENGLVTPEQRAGIALTTITRYLTNPHVRASLALLNSEDLTTDALPTQFDAAIRRFLHDALPTGIPDQKPQVSSRTSSEDRQKYAEKLRQEGVAPTARDQTPYSPASNAAKAAVAASATPAAARSKQSQDNRTYLIKSGFRETSGDKVLSRLVREGKNIRVDDFVFSANYLVRAILEQMIILYAKPKGIGGSSRDLERWIEACAKHAEKDNPPAPRKVIQIMNKTASSMHSGTAPDTLGAGVRGGIIPLSKDVRRAWDTLEPVFEWLLSQV